MRLGSNYFVTCRLCGGLGHLEADCSLKAAYRLQALRQAARGSKDPEILKEAYGTKLALRIAAFLGVLLVSCFALAQTAGGPQSITSVIASGNLVKAIPNAPVVVCGFPAVGFSSSTPCTNTVTTYTDPTGGLTCPSGQQVVTPGTSTCSHTSDIGGNFQFFVNAPQIVTYVFQYLNNWYGPYVQAILAGGGAVNGTVIVSPAQGATSPVTYRINSGVFANSDLGFHDDTNNVWLLTYDPVNRWTFQQNVTVPNLTDSAMAGGPFCVNETGGLLSAATAACPIVNTAQQFAISYYSASGTARTLSGVAAPTGPNNVPQILISTPSGGVGTAPVLALSGIAPRASACPSNVDTILATDRVGYVSWNDAAACAVTLPQANTSGFTSNFAFVACDIGAGTATITPTTSTISFSTGAAYTAGAASMALTTGQCAWIYSDNTNYFAIRR